MKQTKVYFILLTMLFLYGTSAAKTEEDKLRETCNNFIKGRLALRQGDSLLIKSVTEDSLSKLIMLNYKYVKML